MNIEAPEWMEEPVLCMECNEWKELYETEKADCCGKMTCNSCTYMDHNEITFCVSCWENRREEITDE